MLDSKLSDPKAKSVTEDTTVAMPPQRTEARQVTTAPSSTGITSSGCVEPTTEEIAALAYQLWIERGSPHGSHEEDWERAELQLKGSSSLGKSASA